MSHSLFCFLVLVTIPAGASADEPKEPSPNDAAPPRGVTEHDIVPILQLRCVVCHGKRRREAGLDLRSRESILRGGKSGAVIVLGKPEESLLIQRIVSGDMPPVAEQQDLSVRPVAAGELRRITAWIESGAPRSPPEYYEAQHGADLQLTDEDRAFWSCTPPKRPRVPKVDNSSLVRNPIDAFLLEKLEEAGLTFSPEAERPTLIRRLSFDLIGLPPEPEEVAAFVADDSPGAYYDLVDRLLASPHYGERWGGYWLEAAGYADSEGKANIDELRPNAWRYRDYVIRSLNADKPYDQFVLEQIAGDELLDYRAKEELTPGERDKLVATGFLRLGPDGTNAHAGNFVPDRWEVISHELDVLCTTLMATTIGCARCHDHKYDPIPQSDFYSMAAIFTTALDPHDWLRPMERYVDTAPAEELLAWQAEHEKAQDKAAKLAAALEVQAQPLRQELLKERLEAIPEEIRDDVQSANKTPAGKRSPIHKYLVSKFQDKLKVDKIALAGRFPELKSAADGAEEAMAEVKQHARQKPQIRAAFEMGGEPSPVYLHVRGDPLSPGHLVEPRPLAMFSDPSYPYAIQPPWQHDGSSGRRLAFARWLTSPNHPVTTRVLVNRLWHRHFGKGIVPTLGNFGRTGARPTHPELLDWLALEFGAHWSLKSMHRWMVTSTAYRQQSQQTRDLQRKDPQNSLLSRMPLRRLDAEAVRDALLKISGELNPSLFGPILHVEVAMDGNVVVKDTRQGRRRSIYIQQRRTTPLTILETFDKPVLNPNCLIRRGSIVAAQALQMMNSETVRSQAMHFARRVAAEAVGTKAQVTHAYLLALGRAPDSRDLQMAESTLDTLRDEWIAQLREEAEEAPGKTEEALGETGLTATGDATGAKGDPRTEGELRAEAELRALASLCHTLLNSGEFLYLD
jgi:hypothetical protein